MYQGIKDNNKLAKDGDKIEIEQTHVSDLMGINETNNRNKSTRFTEYRKVNSYINKKKWSLFKKAREDRLKLGEVSPQPILQKYKTEINSNIKLFNITEEEFLRSDIDLDEINYCASDASEELKNTKEELNEEFDDTEDDNRASTLDISGDIKIIDQKKSKLKNKKKSKSKSKKRKRKKQIKNKAISRIDSKRRIYKSRPNLEVESGDTTLSDNSEFEVSKTPTQLRGKKEHKRYNFRPNIMIPKSYNINKLNPIRPKSKRRAISKSKGNNLGKLNQTLKQAVDAKQKKLNLNKNNLNSNVPQPSEVSSKPLVRPKNKGKGRPKGSGNKKRSLSMQQSTDIIQVNEAQDNDINMNDKGNNKKDEEENKEDEDGDEEN